MEVFDGLFNIDFNAYLAGFSALQTHTVLLAFLLAIPFYATTGMAEIFINRELNMGLKNKEAGLFGYLIPSFGFMLGMGLIGSGALRFSLYRKKNVGYLIIMRSMYLSAINFWLGFFFFLLLNNIIFGLFWSYKEGMFQIFSQGLILPVSALLFFILLVFFVACSLKDKLPKKLAALFPSFSNGFGICFANTLNWFFLCLPAFVLNPGILDWPNFNYFFSISQAVGISSQVPLGLGVSEATGLIITAGDQGSGMDLLSVIFIHRFLIFLLPGLLTLPIIFMKYITFEYFKNSIADFKKNKNKK